MNSTGRSFDAGTMRDPSTTISTSCRKSSNSSSMPVEKLLELDRRHVWHPYASMPASYDSVAVESANGVYLNVKVASTTGDSTVQLVDGMSSWWAAIHGYNQPHLNQAVVRQLDRMSHVMFGGLTHEPAVRLATRLAHHSGGALEHVFFADSGSVAIEVAMKMAQQYWYNLKLPKKNRFLTVRGGYHGDTFHAMSVCDPVNGMHHLFHTVLQKQLFADKPSPAFGSDDEWNEQHIDSLKLLLENHSDEIAAVILEPIVQGAGGMHFYSPMYLHRVRDLCDIYDVLLIADEIATGFGRTGKFFACEHAQIQPDILCLGKAITGGYLSFAATLTSTRVAQVFQRGEAGVLMHGPTFMGNPLACAVANASLDLLETNHWKKQVPAIEQQLKIELAPCLESPLVRDVRVLGAIGVVELDEPVDMRKMQPAIVQEGVWLRPFAKLLYTMPPFIIEAHQLRKLTQAMVKLTRRRL